MADTAEVTVYSKPNCRDCKATKDLMDEIGIEYTEVNVTEDPSLIVWLKKEGYRQMPVVNAGGEWWSAFQEQKIRGLVEDDNYDDVWG